MMRESIAQRLCSWLQTITSSRPICSRFHAPTAAIQESHLLEALVQTCSSHLHGQPFARAHFSSSRCPPDAASQSQPFVRAHCSTSKCSQRAARAQVHASHSQPFARAHCKIARCPARAALVQAHSYHLQPFARAHFSTSRCPLSAAIEQILEFYVQPFSRAHFSTSRCPPAAAYNKSIRSIRSRLRAPISVLLSAPSRSIFTGICIPIAAISTSPFEDF